MKWPEATAITLIILAIALLVAGAYVNQLEEENVSPVETMSVSVWKDRNQTEKLSEVEWGVMEPGENRTFSCYVRSEANVNATLLLSIEDWKPKEAEDYISLVWNLNGTMLQPSEARQANLTLTVDSAVQNITEFSFNIIVEATG